ncbi:MAG: type IX secretion system protein PorQ [Ignavibacteria bacterium]|nr:type IX secretion system protein PorQ [Ignavibacteria bacterium]
MKTYNLFLSLLLFSAVSFAQTPYEFLRLDASARSAALGGSFITNADDPNVMFYNPANVGFIKKNLASAGFFKNLLDVNSGYLSYTPYLTGIGRVGFGIIYTNYGSFDLTDDFGKKFGTFSANDIAAVFNYNNSVQKNLFYGLNVKLIYTGVHDISSFAAAMDFGITYFDRETQFGVGVAVQNIGTQLKSFYDKKEKLPLDVKFGISKKLDHLPLRLEFSISKLNEDAGSITSRLKNFSVGGEFYLSDVINLRIGYNNEKRRELKIGPAAGIAGFNAGLGINIYDYRFDYGMSSLGSIGLWHRVNLTMTL